VSVVYLVRHARTAWTSHRYCGRSDPPLDESGLEGAERLASELAVVIEGGAEVITSPLRRALETAERLSRATAIDERLVEVDFGAADGLTFAEIAKRWPAIGEAIGRHDAAIDWPGGETWHSVRARARSFGASLARDRDVVVVTHAFFGAALAQELGGGDLVTLQPATVHAIAL
jgi:broad specificity phosphatase PhoE